jgi:hypothetical protein
MTADEGPGRNTPPGSSPTRPAVLHSNCQTAILQIIMEFAGLVFVDIYQGRRGASIPELALVNVIHFRGFPHAD